MVCNAYSKQNEIKIMGGSIVVKSSCAMKGLERLEKQFQARHSEPGLEGVKLLIGTTSR